MSPDSVSAALIIINNNLSEARLSNATTWSFRLEFNSPAFLGNASQSGQWRTPPVKAQLRQWWRVVYFAKHADRFDMSQMRKAEGEIFGQAASDADSRCSRVRLRLSHWQAGSLAKNGWKGLEKIDHPEVNQKVGADLYLGYGPLGSGFRGLVGLKNQAIQAGEHAELRIALVDADDESVEILVQTLALMNDYGAMGGRSRNGWGSYSLKPLDPMCKLHGTGVNVRRPWHDALALTWPHAIGLDGQGAPLVWQTQAKGNWQAVMESLADLKIKLRTQQEFSFAGKSMDSRKHHPNPAPRHWLSYPVTGHEVCKWQNLRLPNSLRFKIRRTPNGDEFYGVVFHVPCSPPESFKPQREELTRVWSTVHQFLDAQTNQLRRIGPAK